MIKALIRIEILIPLLAVVIWGARALVGEGAYVGIAPENVFQFELSIQFDPGDDDVRVKTYLPQSSERQVIYSERFFHNHMEQVLYENPQGLGVQWSGTSQASNINYSALIKTSGYKFNLSDDITHVANYDDHWSEYLVETPEIPVKHPEIEALWAKIKPITSKSLVNEIRVIYDYVASLETLPFKGVTDSLTVLRLGAASCNGKSRLFVSLARLNGIPARLVGGIILNEGKKKTSHQWVEINIDGHWVPFDPTNNYFAELPPHYLELYRGDMSLFSHTANINFDYSFQISERQVAPVLFKDEISDDEVPSPGNIATLMSRLSVPTQGIAVFLMLPMCALVITFLRNMVGLKSFGIFMPMLIASMCAVVGLAQGVIGFIFIILVAFLGQLLLNKLNLLKIPRLAAIISIVNISTLLLLVIIDKYSGVQFGLLSLFPVIIISFIADKLHDLVEAQEWNELLLTSLGTAVSIVLCYLCIDSAFMQGLFAVYPEAYLIVLASQIFLGRWSGLRISEIIRFRQLWLNKINVLGMNGRNKDYVQKLNSKALLKLAADKLASKKILEGAGVPVPGTIAKFENFDALEKVDEVLAELNDFVVKPNAGSQGRGILVVMGREGDCFRLANGKLYRAADISRHIQEILNGNYSQWGESDIAYIEPLIKQHAVLQTIAPYGLSDIRVIVESGRIISAMLRIPTTKSNGKANLHQGALGAAIDLKTGTIIRCRKKDKLITAHIDSGVNIVGEKVPYWPEILKMSLACAKSISLGYMGVDICIDESIGPLVLEVNGRPGLEIQNVNNQGIPALIQQALVNPIVVPAIKSKSGVL